MQEEGKGTLVEQVQAKLKTDVEFKKSFFQDAKQALKGGFELTDDEAYSVIGQITCIVQQERKEAGDTVSAAGTGPDEPEPFCCWTIVC